MRRYDVITGPTKAYTEHGITRPILVKSFADALNERLAELAAQGITNILVDCKPMPRDGFHSAYLSWTDTNVESTTYSVAQVAEITGYTPSTIRKRVREGKIPAIRLGRNPRIPVAAVEDLLGGSPA